MQWFRSVRRLAVVAALAAAPAVAVPAEEEPPPRAEALAQVRKAVEDARKAERGKKETKDALLAVVPLLRHHADPKRDDLGAYLVWNDLVQVSAYHGAKVPPEMRTVEGRAADLRFAIPRSDRWKIRGREGDQLAAKVVQTGADDKPMRTIKFWVYRFDTVYTGARDIGGENAKGLAESDLEGDKWSSEKVVKRSTRVTKQRLNANVKEANFYEIRHFDLDLKEEVHRRNWYFKGKLRTYNVETIAHLGALDRPPVDPFLRWELEDGGPELRAFLDSIADTAK